MTPTNTQQGFEIPKKKIGLPIIIAGALVGGLFLYLIFGNMACNTNNSGFITIRQSLSGSMTAIREEGLYWLGFGSRYPYKRSGAYRFASKEQRKIEGVGSDISAAGDPIEVRFNDGGTASISGEVRFVLPEEDFKKDLKNPDKIDPMIAMHLKYRSYDNLISTGIKQLIMESIILSAAMMSSEESYTTKRAEFSEISWDQIMNGIYLTEQEKVETKNLETGEVTTRFKVKTKIDPRTKQPIRKDNPLSIYGIRISQFVITNIDYEEGIKAQIAQKRQALMTISASRANAELQSQERLTAEEVGKKNVVQSRYVAEVEKIKAEVDAQKEKEVAEIEAKKKADVAKIEAQTALFEKKAAELRAQANFEKDRKKFVADNALELKLNLMVSINKMWAEAFQKSPNRFVPRIILGISTGGSNSPVESFLKLLTVKAAEDLSVIKK